MTVMPEGPLARDFRTAMRHVPAPLYLVGARDDDGIFHGMAATAVTSLSMEPPSVILAVNRQASAHPVIVATGLFSLINLCVAQRDIIPLFASSAARSRRFAAGLWQMGYGGLPGLKEANFTLFCAVQAAQEFGTHTVFFGAVRDVMLPADSDPDPLVWMNGDAARVTSV